MNFTSGTSQMTNDIIFENREIKMDEMPGNKDLIDMLSKRKDIYEDDDERKVIVNVLKRMGISLDKEERVDKNEREQKAPLINAKDSCSDSKTIKPEVPISLNMNAKRQAPIICKITVDSKGVIMEGQENCGLVFMTQFIKGRSFFELMAGYNYKYLQNKFGEDPLVGMAQKKQKMVIRFSLNEWDEQMNPIIVTAKIIFLINKATIYIRRSSEKSSKEFHERIRSSIQQAQNRNMFGRNN